MKRRYVLLSVFLATTSASAAVIRPSMRHEAGGQQTRRYVTEGFFVGGERTVTAAKLTDIRRAKSGDGSERVVFDLSSIADDKEAMPYFQVQAAPEEGRFIVSIWANVAYDFEPARVSKMFAKSGHFKRLNVLPRVEEGLTIIELTLADSASKKKPKFEVFRLSGPSRIIMDIL
ncbi:MAG: hypothetical protein HY075_13725 [Deltaproteobacteria bacterium]|nr:hypothetical protein [Deltaproteobacteria bacterium]